MRRYAWVWMLVLLLFGSLVPVSSASTLPVVTLQVDRTQVHLGEMVVLTIGIEQVSDLYGTAIDIYYDPAMLEPVLPGPGVVTSTTTGGLVTAGLAPEQFVVDMPQNRSVQPNRQSLVALRLGQQPGATGSGILGVLQFRALALGNTFFFLQDPTAKTSTSSATTGVAGLVNVQLSASTGQSLPFAVGDGVNLQVISRSGSLTGRIHLASRSDHSGAVVTLALPGDGGQLTAHTDASGLFVLDSIAPGTYEVRVTAPSFLTTKVLDVPITIDAITSLSPLNITLMPGNIVDNSISHDAVFLEDLRVLAQTWGPTTAHVYAADLDNDGQVGLSDLTLLADNWGRQGADGQAPWPGTVIHYTAP